MIIHLSNVLCAFVFGFSLIGPVGAALLGRLPATPGGTDYQAYYDTVLDITWIADTNLAASNTFGLPYNTNLGDHPDDDDGPGYTEQILSNGYTSWGGALHWIDAMNDSNYLGFNDWRLPTMLDTGPPGCDSYAYVGTDCGWNVQTGSAATTVYSELASLWYDTLGNLADMDTSGDPQPGWGLHNTGPFANFYADGYWTGLDYATSDGAAWAFSTNNGWQFAWFKLEAEDYATGYYAWAVRSGDVILHINIDIRPGNPRNIIIPWAKGKIWVAVLSDKNFELPFDPASQIDIPEVGFGPQEAKAERSLVKDINRDGVGDLMLQFKIAETGISETATEATLSGKTFDGQKFSGIDSIQVVGQKPVVVCDPKDGCGPN